MVKLNKKNTEVDVFAKKQVVSSVANADLEISLRKARTVKMSAKVGEEVEAPFEESIGRIEVAAARQHIATQIRDLEQSAIYDEFRDKEGSIVSGTIHKKEHVGFVVSVGDSLAFLPMSNAVSGESLRVGYPVRALLKEVLPSSRGGHQLILDRSSADFICKLIELEIPEVFDGLVEIKKVVRTAGYKSKVVVISNNKDIDPVGTCVGVGGARIKPILRELGSEKIDLIAWTEDPATFVKNSLKPAEIDEVEIFEDEKKAVVWLPEEQRSFAIGKGGQNIGLATELTGFAIQLQGAEGGGGNSRAKEERENLFYDQGE